MPTISNLTRLSYAATDTAGQLVFAVISTYLLYFYTDVYGIPVGIAGTILLVARCIDGVDAPLWGMILDKTRSRWGRSRPWFLWLCGPYRSLRGADFPDTGPEYPRQGLVFGCHVSLLPVSFTPESTHQSPQFCPRSRRTRTSA